MLRSRRVWSNNWSRNARRCAAVPIRGKPPGWFWSGNASREPRVGGGRRHRDARCTRQESGDPGPTLPQSLDAGGAGVAARRRCVVAAEQRSRAREAALWRAGSWLSIFLRGHWRRALRAGGARTTGPFCCSMPTRPDTGPCAAPQSNAWQLKVWLASSRRVRWRRDCVCRRRGARSWPHAVRRISTARLRTPDARRPAGLCASASAATDGVSPPGQVARERSSGVAPATCRGCAAATPTVRSIQEPAAPCVLQAPHHRGRHAAPAPPQSGSCRVDAEPSPPGCEAAAVRRGSSSARPSSPSDQTSR